MTNTPAPLQLPDYSIDYTPTEIVIHNLDGLTRAVDAYAHRYSNVVVTADTEKSAKDTRAKLNKLSIALDNRRKEIHKDYNKPYQEFADQIKQLQSVVKDTIEPIDSALAELTEQQRKLRQEHVLALIAEMAPNFGVKAEDLPINPKWLNKSTSKKTVTDGVAADMKQLKIDQDRHQQDVTTLTKYADAQNVDPAPWLDQLEQGQDLDYLLKAVDNQVRVNAEREQAKQRKLEAEAAEAKTHQEVKGDTVIDTNTGEVVNRSVDLRITTTIAEMKLLKAYMDKRGIKYHKVGA